ncbi:hypothetical protein VP01_3635g1 [Puccinia sorghi]|uniref:Uncharacterized protein n=1 Tax=Puccinia sorghi TaxID=27349 RepID=A0A0L6UUS9_9BASI|nr:hypothetical protein VP01_3635g1 [Puccinia sorghi]
MALWWGWRLQIELVLPVGVGVFPRGRPRGGGDMNSKSFQKASIIQSQALFERSRRPCPVSTIRMFFRKIDCQHSAYNIGLTGPKAQRAMKQYSSHRRIPGAALMDVHVMSG